MSSFLQSVIHQCKRDNKSQKEIAQQQPSYLSAKLRKRTKTSECTLSHLDRFVKVESPHGIVLLLQSAQPLQPPGFVPVDLLLRLVAEGVVDVRVEPSAGLARLDRIPDLTGPGDGGGIED